ncbi:MAG TPA: hypothetical protein VF064_06515 [Pyrinomonadaceae bacterium]
MITGFNTDIQHGGVTYHVQTEDKGLETPLILSLVYVGGAIIASKRSRYEDLIESGFDEQALTERLQRQHKLICAAIRSGRVEDLKRMTGREEPAKAEKPAKKEKAPKRAAAPREEQPEAATEKQHPARTVKQREEPREPEAPHEPATAPILFGEDQYLDEIYRREAAEAAAATAVETNVEAEPVADVAPPPSPAPPPPVHVPAEAVRVLEGAQGQPFAEATGAEEIYLTLLEDEGEFRAGQLATIKIRVGRGQFGQHAVADAAVTIKVLGTTFRPLILSTKTGVDGVAVVRALLPRFTSGRAAIIIRASSGEEFAEMRRIIHQA